MTKPSSPYATPNTSQHNKPRESITSSTIGGTSVSRRSSTSSLSPSTSVLLSAAAARPTPSRSSSRSSSSYRKGQSSPILPQLSSSSLSSSTRNNKLEQIIQVGSAVKRIKLHVNKTSFLHIELLYQNCTHHPTIKDTKFKTTGLKYYYGKTKVEQMGKIHFKIYCELGNQLLVFH